MKNRIVWILILLRDIIMMPLVILMPRDHHKIVFGAWGGRQFGCNPKYLFEYMCKRGGFKCVWVGDKSLKMEVLKVPNAIFAAKGSILALWHCLTARFYAHNVQWRNDIINIPRCRRFEVLYLTHGFPDKKAGDFQYNGNGPEARVEECRCFVRQLLHDWLVALGHFLYGQESWFSASSKQGEDLRVDGLPWRLSHDRALRCGIPRADYLINNANNSELRRTLRDKLSDILDIPVDKRWVVFVPTWRHEAKYLFSFSTSSKVREYENVLQAQNAVLIEKQHPNTLEVKDFKTESVGSIKVVTKEQARQIDTQELLMACDVLITDYSSIYYDFVLMNRPVIHFIYDYDHFMNLDMGFMFDIKDYGGGPFAESEEELLKCMSESDAQLLEQRNAATKTIQLEYESGHSCEGYYDLISRLSTKRNFFV